MKKLFSILCLSLLSLCCEQGQACTGLKIIAKDGSLIHGRTLEFAVPLDLSMVVIPRNYYFAGKTTQGKGLEYQTKYATLGAIAFKDVSILDGINEAGLAVGTFYFPGFASYSDLTKENQAKALSAADFPNWILTQFASIEEVKQALSQVVIVPTPLEGWGNITPPFHYIVYDKTGKSLVIEPVDHQLKVYDNPLGVLTNSPSFDWHMTNLRNYINLKTVDAAPLTVGNLTFAALGKGSGMHGLPGDFTPPSRFVRAAIYGYTALQSENASEAVLQAFHLLNQFDIPLGVVRDDVKGEVEADYTLLTAVRDPAAKKMYFKSYQDQTIYSIDLNRFNPNAKEIKSLHMNGQQKYIDISNELK